MADDNHNLFEVEIANLPDLLKQIAGFPGAVKTALKASYKYGLSRAKSVLLGTNRGGKHIASITQRYNIKPSLLRDQIGKPRMFGDVASLTISGSKIPLHMFSGTIVDTGTEGVYAQILKNSAPAQLRHAFMAKRKGPVFQRESKDRKRFPIHWTMGLSVAEMAMQSSEVLPKVSETTEEATLKELRRLIDLFLSGRIRLENGRISAVERE